MKMLFKDITVFILILLSTVLVLGCSDQNTEEEDDTSVQNPPAVDTVPTHAAAGISFTDIDAGGGEIAGDIVITKAEDESDIADYVLYWGSNATTK